MPQKATHPIFHKMSFSLIMIICVLISIYWIEHYFLETNILFENFSLDNKTISFETSYCLITYGFLHGDFAHLLFNCVWLIIFGTAIMRYFGTLRTLIIFLGGIIIGGLSHLAFIEEQNIALIGASAGVTALCGAALRFMMKIEFDFRGHPLLLHLYDSRFLIILALFSLVDIGQALIQNHMANAHIAWYAHLSGIFFGAFMMSIPFINKNALFRKES